MSKDSEAPPKDSEIQPKDTEALSVAEKDHSFAYDLSCPHCQTPVRVTQVQGDRCPGCNFEFTVFEPGQEIIAREFYEVLTGPKYDQHLPNGARVITHG